MTFFDDFRAFAFKGNVVDLALGVVIGAAFGKIVSALVADVVMPLVALVLPSGDWKASGLVLRHAAEPKDDVVLRYGDLLGAVLDFLVVALVLFIAATKLVHASRANAPVPPAPPATRACPFCLESVPRQATKCRACASLLPS